MKQATKITGSKLDRKWKILFKQDKRRLGQRKPLLNQIIYKVG